MPAYFVEFATDRGPQRVRFTLDADRPLYPQVHQILEELRQRGVLLQGGRDDELGAVWNGIDLDLTKTPAQLGLSPSRALELRMRRSAAKAVTAPEPPAAPFVPKGAYAAALTGFAGGLLGWFAASFISELSPLIPNYERLDQTVALLLGAGPGAFVLGGDSLRRNRSLVLGALAGLALGALGGLAGASGGLAVARLLPEGAGPRGFLVGRIAVWGLTGTVTALVLASWWVRREPRRLLDGLLWGMASGTVGGLVFCLPGPSDFWQGLAFVVVGSGIGAGVCAPALRRAAAIVELESRRQRPIGLLALREWPLDGSASFCLPRSGARGKSAGAPTIGSQGGRYILVPGGTDQGDEGASGSLRVSGRPVAGPVYLRNGDTIEIGTARYRFRRLREPAA